MGFTALALYIHLAMDRGAVPGCAQSRGASREMAGRARTTDPAYLLWTFEQMYLNLFKKQNKTSQGSWGGGRGGQSNIGSWEPMQEASLGRLLSWNLASSEMPNCSSGSLPVIFLISFL